MGTSATHSTDQRTTYVTARSLHHIQPEFRLSESAGSDSLAARNYVADIFQQHYTATISHFLPLFLEMWCLGQRSALVGIRSAHKQALFLEQYLSLPAEQILAAITTGPVTRSSLVEIGNLVATRRGTSQVLFTVLAEALYRANMRWLLFTATPQVAQIIRKMHYEPQVLAHADPHCLPDAGTSWGSYYAQQPTVMAVELREAHRRLALHPASAAFIQRYNQTLDTLAERIREFHHD